MIANLLEEKTLSNIVPQKNENCSENIVLVTSNLCSKSSPSQAEVFTGKIESISNAASPATKVCADQSADSITQRQV